MVQLGLIAGYFLLRKTDPQSSKLLKYRREHVASECDSFVRHFENEMPLTINHGREMSNISGNALVPLMICSSQSERLVNHFFTTRTGRTGRGLVYTLSSSDVMQFTN